MNDSCLTHTYIYIYMLRSVCTEYRNARQQQLSLRPECSHEIRSLISRESTVDVDTHTHSSGVCVGIIEWGVCGCVGIIEWGVCGCVGIIEWGVCVCVGIIV